MTIADKPAVTPHYRDLRGHIAELEREGLLVRVEREINKDTELHPLVRWQYRGGIGDEKRRAFLFTNVVDSRGRKYPIPVLVCGFAGSRRIYTIGMNCALADIAARWSRALNHPIKPTLTEGAAPCQEIVTYAKDIAADGGLLEFPVPISTPGYDNGPYLTSAAYITKDPETGNRNMGVYRGLIKGPTSVAMQFSTKFKDGAIHWNKAKARGESLPVAIVIGAPPAVAYASVQRVPFDTDELAVAGGLAGVPIRLVKCKTIDLEVPAEAEVVIEGFASTEYTEPEGPFGESNGYINLRTQSPVVTVTCITQRENPVWTSFLSQVTPSESSTIKIVAYEPMFMNFLHDDCGVKSLTKVVMHEPLSNIRPIIFLQFTNSNEGEIWRALKLASSFHTGVGKIIIAVDSDIDPKNLDAVMWSLAYRMTPHRDVQIVRGYYKGGAPPFRDVPAMENSVMLINATLREKMPPISLPKKEFMERSLEIWNELNLGPITPEVPWHGYSLGEWDEEYDREAALATESRWLETSAKLSSQRRATNDHEIE